MKKLIFGLILMALYSCDEKSVRVDDSVGSANRIIVIVENELWDGAVGESIRATLAAPIDGLVREEPLFEINQMNPNGFKGLAKKARNYMIVSRSDSSMIAVRKNQYATPQTGVVVKARNVSNITELIDANESQIRDAFNQGEISYKQKLMDRVAINTEKITNDLGIDITVPNGYRFAKSQDGFYWLRRDIREGTMDLMLYEVPLNTIRRDSNVVEDIIKMRDSVGRAMIPTNQDRPFITEKAFAPYVNESQIDGKFAYESKGLWEVKDAFMSGPFINYAIYNQADNNWLVAEGYVFAPSAEHRDYMFELEAILKSIDFEE